MNKTAVILGKRPVWLGSETIILWEEYPSSRNEVSLPKLVEDEANLIKKEYLAWAHNLSVTKFGNKKLPDLLAAVPHISAWWSSVFVEKSLYRTPQIYDVMRLRALERFCVRHDINDLILCIPDRRLDEVLKSWCRRTGRYYEWRPENPVQKRSLKTKLKYLLPSTFLAARYLILYLRRNRIFLRSETPKGTTGLSPCGLAIFSYFDNLDRDKVKSGRFGSLYWGELPSLIGKQKRIVNWLFWFIPSKFCSNPKAALELQQEFNLNEDQSQRFFFIEQWLSWHVVLEAIIIYLKNCYRTPKHRSIRRVMEFEESELNFWPVIKESWIDSTHGVAAISNAMTLVLLKETVKCSPKQDLAICLAEFQGWERSLIQSWRNYDNGKIFGYAHATVRFFDLRYFDDAASYMSGLPRYDNLLVNGQHAWDMLTESGYPLCELQKVEALRYLYLRSFSIEGPKSVVSSRPDSISLLVLTDYDNNASVDQLKLLGHALNSTVIRKPLTIRIKPHPNFEVENIASTYLSTGAYEIIDVSLTEALPEADMVYASNFTSAALDAAFLNLPIIISLAGAQINMSPLRGVEGVTFVSDVSELTQALNDPKPLCLPEDFFYLNEDLRLWRDLLAH